MKKKQAFVCIRQTDKREQVWLSLKADIESRLGVIHAIDTGKAKGYVSALTFANLVYIMRKKLDPATIEDIFRKLNLIFDFTDFSVSDLTQAAGLNWKDFEDAVQSVTAERVHADYIITRNIRDFSKSKIIAFTPSELLARI